MADNTPDIYGLMGGQPSAPPPPKGKATKLPDWHNALPFEMKPESIEALKNSQLFAPERSFEKSPFGRAAISFAKVPSEALMGVLGAGERYNSEALANMPTSSRFRGPNLTFGAAGLAGPLGQAIAALDPKTREAFGKQWAAAFNPYSDAETRSEQATGLTKLLQKMPDNFWGKLGIMGTRMLFQAAKDPTSLMTPEVGGEAALSKLTDVVNSAINYEGKSKIGNVARGVARFTATNVAERSKRKVMGKAVAALDPATIAAVNTAREAGIGYRAHAEAHLEHIMDQYAPILRQRQRLVDDAAATGKQNANLTRWGPVPAKMKRQLSRDLGVKIPPTQRELTGLATTKQPVADQIRETVGEAIDTKQREVTRAALHEHVKDLPPGELGLFSTIGTPMKQRLTTFFKKQFPNMKDESIAQLADKVAPMASAGLKFGQTLSRAQVEALLATGFPHLRNVAVAGFLSLGEVGMSDALRMMLPKKFPGAINADAYYARLEKGAAAHFALGKPTTTLAQVAADIPGLRKFTTGTLDRGDMAIRAARLRQLDKQYPHWTEAQKLDRVNEDIGRYHTKSQMTEWAQGVGGNFPQWHGYNVPMMTIRAALRYPGRLGRYARGQQQLNDAFFPDSPSYTLLGGPPDEAASAAADPARMAFAHHYPSYFGGSSMLGPILSLPLQFGMGDLKSNLMGLGAGFLPGGNILLDATVNPYKSPWGAGQRAAGSAAGVYTQKRTPQMRERAQNALVQPEPQAGPGPKKSGDIYDLMGGSP